MTLSGFLGAGKTTTLVAVAKHLQSQGRRVAVITNDQGTELVDTQLARSAIAEAGEVTGGCFCCRFEDLLTVAQRLVDGHQVDTLLAEAVGSCTDLQATVIRPLSAHYGEHFTPAPSSSSSNRKGLTRSVRRCRWTTRSRTCPTCSASSCRKPM